MKLTHFSTRFFLVTEVPALDPIGVFFTNYLPGKGEITIVCCGAAWTAYFGATGERTIAGFFLDAGTDYLVNKLGITPMLKQRKKDLAYLRRIIEAIKAALAEDPVFVMVLRHTEAAGE